MPVFQFEGLELEAAPDSAVPVCPGAFLGYGMEHT